MLPAGVITSVDHDNENVFVNRTKDEIKNAPEFDEAMRNDENYRTELGFVLRPGRPWLPRLGLSLTQLSPLSN